MSNSCGRLLFKLMWRHNEIIWPSDDNSDDIEKLDLQADSVTMVHMNMLVLELLSQLKVHSLWTVVGVRRERGAVRQNKGEREGRGVWPSRSRVTHTTALSIWERRAAVISPPLGGAVRPSDREPRACPNTGVTTINSNWWISSHKHYLSSKTVLTLLTQDRAASVSLTSLLTL